MSGCGGGEEEEVALRQVEESVQDAGFGAVETCGAQGVEEHGAQEGAVEVGGWGCHFAAGWWGWVVGLVVWWVCYRGLSLDHVRGLELRGGSAVCRGE